MSIRLNLDRLARVLGILLMLVLVSTADGQQRVAWWRAEWDATDSAGSHHGQLLGAVGYTNGIVGTAFNLRAPASPEQGVKVPSDPALDLGAGAGFTVLAWINPKGYMGGIYPILEWSNGYQPYSTFSISGPSPDNIPMRCLYAKLGPGQAPYFYTAADLIKSNQWQQVGFSWDRASATVTLFLNGGAVLQAGTSYVPLTTGYITIGCRPGFALGFTGAIDEVSLFDRALSSSEVRALFLTEAPPRLEIRRIVPELATLVWSQKYYDLSLEQAPSPSGPWEPVALSPTPVGLEFWLHQPATNLQSFFRLSHP